MVETARRRAPRLLRHLLLACVALLVLIVVGIGAVMVTFDPNSLKPRIVEAVKRETGRDIALNGPISLAFALRPTLAARDVALANPPGFSRPQMATLAQLDLQLALFPLLHGRVEIDRLVLERPDILLETDAQGRPNWEFAREAAAPPAPRPGAVDDPAEAKQPTRLSIADIRIEEGTLTWRDDRTQHSATVGVKRFEASAASADAPVHLDAAANANGTDFAFSGEIGPLARLLDTAATTAWPVHLTATAAGAKLSIDGSLTRPLQGRGYSAKLAATVPDLPALAPLAPGVKLLPLHDVNFAAQLADIGAALPEVTALTLHVGRSDLSATVAGLKLDRLDVAAARLDQPVTASAQGSYADQPLTVNATLGAPAVLLPGSKASGPFPIDVGVQAAGASLAVKGVIAQPQALAGVDVAVNAKIANLAALAPLVHRPLPALQSIAFDGKLQDANGSLRQGVALRGAKLTLPQGDLAGDATLAIAARPSLQANLQSDTIDLDALRTIVDATPAPPAPAQAAPASPPVPVPVPARAGGGGASPLAPLREANADVTLAVALLKSGGAQYRNVNTHLVLRDGKLTLDPFAADLPEGHVAGAFEVDVNPTPPTMALRLHAPALALRPLLATFGQPAVASGNLEVYADLRGAGETEHAIIGSLSGSLGLAMVNGTIDNRLLGGTLGSILREINLLDLVGRGGTSQVQCFATRIDARNGVGAVRTLVLASSLLTADAVGTLNLGSETLDLHVRSQARVGGTGLVVPLHVTGPFRSPQAAPEPAAALADNAGTIAGLATGATPLGMIAGALAGQKLLGNTPGENCNVALAVARGSAVPASETTQQPRAGTPAPAPAPAKPKAPDVGNLLRQFLR